MSKEDQERKTTEYYDKHTKEWLESHHGNDEGTYWDQEMDRLQELLPQGNILEIGSGPGRDAEALIARGYGYVGTDISAGLIQVAQARNPGAPFIHQSVYDLDLGTPFDGFWSVATLLHIPKTRISEALDAIRRNMKKDAVGFISIKQGEGEVVEENTGRFFSYFSHEEFLKILLDNDFEVIDSGVKPGKAKAPWLMYWIKV